MERKTSCLGAHKLWQARKRWNTINIQISRDEITEPRNNICILQVNKLPPLLCPYPLFSHLLVPHLFMNERGGRIFHHSSSIQAACRRFYPLTFAQKCLKLPASSICVCVCVSVSFLLHCSLLENYSTHVSGELLLPPVTLPLLHHTRRFLSPWWGTSCKGKAFKKC